MSLRLGGLTIAQNGTKSNGTVISRWIKSLYVEAPAVLDAGTTFTVQTSLKRNPQEADWTNLTSGGVNVALTAGQSTQISDPAFRSIRVLASAAVANARAFILSYTEDLSEFSL